MCLTIKKGQESKIATEDIVCYKSVRQIRIERQIKGVYFTQYQFAKVELGNTYTSDLVVQRHLIEEDNVDIGLHTFVNYNDAYRNARMHTSIFHGTSVIKCIIPKGAKYYFGTFGFIDSYASDVLTYVEVLDTIPPSDANSF